MKKKKKMNEPAETPPKIILIDGDSIAYMAAAADTMKKAMGVVDEIMTQIKNLTWEGRFELYVETPKLPKVNFRNHVATSRKYKGNRDKLTKSILLEPVKNYMYDRYTAEYINIYESEDVIRFRAEELGLGNFIIAAIDKDLDQIPGSCYNYRTREKREITNEQANYSFYSQLLTGDSVDNIPGLPGIGKKKALDILENYRNSPPVVMARVVALSYAHQGMPYAYMLEQARLLYLLKNAQDVYTSPITDEEYKEFTPYGDAREGD